MRSSVPVCLLYALLFIPLSGCGSSDKHYTLIGRVVSKVPATRAVVVDHGEIPGFMAAMTMPYAVADGVDLSGIEPGDRICADIDVKPDGQYSLDRIAVTDSSHREKAPKEAKQLWPGKDIPDVELVNQDGKMLRLPQFRGNETGTGKESKGGRAHATFEREHRPEIRHAAGSPQIRSRLSERGRQGI